jgi:hypothetical protein
MSGQRHAPAALLLPGKGPPLPIVQEAGWAPEPVWTQSMLVSLKTIAKSDWENYEKIERDSAVRLRCWVIFISSLSSRFAQTQGSRMRCNNKCVLLRCRCKLCYGICLMSLITGTCLPSCPLCPVLCCTWFTSRPRPLSGLFLETSCSSQT